MDTIKSMVKVSKAQSSKVVTVSAMLSRRWPEARTEGFLSPQNSVVVS